MTTTEVTNSPAIEAWRTKFAAVIDAEKTRLRNDPRFTAWASQQPEPWTTDDCLAKWIVTNLPTLPEPPRPAWAVDLEIDMASYREITLVHSGPDVTRGKVNARAQQAILVDIDAVFLEVTTGINMILPDDFTYGIVSDADAQDMIDVLTEVRAVLDD